MQLRLMWKILILGFLTLVFTVPFVIIGMVSHERKGYRDRVVAEIASSTAGSQQIAGPVLVLPYRERVVNRTTDATGRITTVEHAVTRQHRVLPESLAVEGDVSLEERYRGIYKAHLYRADLRLAGAFALPDLRVIASRPDFLGWDSAFVAVAVTDPRGMRQAPRVEWNGRALVPKPGTGAEGMGPGFSAALDEPWTGVPGRPVSFRITLPVVGTERLHLVPVGKQSRVHLRSPWPHPSFTGQFLPDTRSVSSSGFDARWDLSRFATDVERSLGDDVRTRGGEPTVGVEFVAPVDVYRLSERGLKYGLLFVLLTFVAFFLVEVLRGLAVHPVQYGLVAAALVLFFLLLISLSEHLPFAAAYAVASAACITLLVVYVAHVLRGWGRGLVFGGGLAALYGLLYVVLQSEDYALLLGTLLLLGVLAAVMWSTRRVDWYRVGESMKADAG